MNEEFVSQHLGKYNLTLTVQRKVILDVLNRDHDHKKADEIYRLVKKILPRVSFGTVYRNLRVLTDAGLVDCLKSGREQALYEIKKAPHYHIVCERCGSISDLNGVHISRLDQEIAQLTGYQVLTHNLEVQGICPDCRTTAVHIEDLSED